MKRKLWTLLIALVLIMTMAPMAVFANTGAEDVKQSCVLEHNHKDATTAIPVTKVWVDDFDRDGIRPDAVKVYLYADGEYTGKSMCLTKATLWTGVFKNLPVCEDGKLIKYTVTENYVKGYFTNIVPTVVPTVCGTKLSYTVYNTHVPAVTAVRGEKVWDDNDNEAGIRPESITVKLYADCCDKCDGLVATKTVKGEGNVWDYEFCKLPKNCKGEPIVYTVKEVAVDGYTTVVDGYTITNTYVPAPVDPTEPTDPTDPTEPTEPVDPEDPTAPVDPEDPTAPVDPEDPTAPVDPEDPADQDDPAGTEEDPAEEPQDPATKTNDPSAMMPFAIAMVAAAGAAVVALKKRTN